MRINPVRAEDHDLAALAAKLPASASSVYGAPFYENVQAVQRYNS